MFHRLPQTDTFDWPHGLTRHRLAVLRLVAMMLATIAVLGREDGGRVLLPASVRRALRRMLRPAESAVRRLIVVAARVLPFDPPAPRTKAPGGGGARKSARSLAFPLVDPLPRFAFEPVEVRPAPASPDDAAQDATAAVQRLRMVRAALDDMPAQLRRLARWEAKRAARHAAGRAWRFHPIRNRRPPGAVRRPRHAMHRVLDECHRLFLGLPEPIDSS